YILARESDPNSVQRQKLEKLVVRLVNSGLGVLMDQASSLPVHGLNKFHSEVYSGEDLLIARSVKPLASVPEIKIYTCNESLIEKWADNGPARKQLYTPWRAGV
ncbi:MAG TPA: hypothetical protein VH186_08340, partial [Chloroflexia bacterium]|nr:hypothetical protein [Chloroflexia bacterium]